MIRMATFISQGKQRFRLLLAQNSSEGLKSLP